MVEVVTKEEFDNEVRRLLVRLDNMEKSTKKSMDARVKLFAAINTRLDKIDEDRVTIHKRLDDIAEKSKSIFTRIKEAVEPVPE